MNLTTVLSKAWQLVWSYRALWLFGAILALVGVTMIYPGPWWPDQEDNHQWTKIKISDTITFLVPGDEMTIDFTAPEGIHIILPENTSWVSWSEFRELVAEVNRETSINLWPILTELIVILAISILLGMVARYIAETALIRMVAEVEETGRQLSVGQGLRIGWSLQAWRLFLLDLTVGILGVVAFILVLGLVAAPVLLATGSQEGILITAGVSTLGLLVLAIYLWLAARAVLSLLLQTIRRACVLEEQSLLASIRQGFRITKHHLKEVGPLWLAWMGLRLVWVPFGALVLLLVAPILLLTILTGVTLGIVPAALVTAITSIFTRGATPWIMGALAGFPIFIVIAASPMLFVNGLVEVYLSTIWTLAYRDLRTMEQPAPVPEQQIKQAPAHGAVG